MASSYAEVYSYAPLSFGAHGRRTRHIGVVGMTPSLSVVAKAMPRLKKLRRTSLEG